MSERTYAVRYLCEPWDKPGVADDQDLGVLGKFAPKSVDNHGYADRLFLASIAYTDQGKGSEISSILLMDTRDGVTPQREILEAVKAAIEHHLEHHCY